MNTSEIVKSHNIIESLEATKRYIFGIAEKLKLAKPFAGNAGPLPTIKELQDLVNLLANHARGHNVDSTPLLDFLRQEKKRLSPGIVASGLTLAGKFDKAVWNDAALKVDECLNVIKDLTALPQGEPIHSLGNRNYKVGGEVVVVEQSENDILQVFFNILDSRKPTWIAILKPDLENQSGYGNAARLLKAMKTKYPILAHAIDCPGAKGRGGLKVFVVK